MPGPRPKFNYEELYQEFCHLKSVKELTLNDFAAERNLNASNLSTRFAEFKRQAQLNIFRGRNPEILVKAQSNVSEALENGKLKPQFRAEFALNTLKAIADREGMSPQAQIINIKTMAAAIGQAITVPLFGEEPEQFKELLGGTE